MHTRTPHRRGGPVSKQCGQVTAKGLAAADEPPVRGHPLVFKTDSPLSQSCENQRLRGNCAEQRQAIPSPVNGST